MVETASFTVFLETIGVLAVVIFVLSSMLGMGFSLTLREIAESLKNLRLVVLALVANFVLVPLLALVLLLIFPLSEGLSIGLFVLGAAAGAPFLPKLAQVAKGNMAFAMGLMVLLMVVTIAYMPIVLPLLLPGIAIDPWAIARSLVLLMLIPLAIALLVRARYERVATGLLPLMNQAANLSLLTLIVAFFVVYFDDIGGVVGTTAVLATIIFVLVSFAIGYLLGGPDGGTKRVLGVGTAQRNISAALAIAALNFTDPDVMVMILVVGLAGLVLLMLLGGERGRRAEAASGTARQERSAKRSQG
ncbi:bile acid:sodium symporter family protein [Methanoculleus sp. FWC-SCC1]|uniref:Bile acid:sodium symporter family protein n=1 Tax=Methanoculleus frigidifontis TaxID=2584085 RepID=A0ABT8MDJ9_9EURY|nr:bile acid:sodium symporter [Methanoculleus sp. FWC-SCC1]MDN7026025.1 bile acid:sodium symporter family protein [Methanoculleus sp. FWC-SCC1]